MASEIQVFAPGSTVRLPRAGVDGIDAEVLAVSVEACGHVTYKVAIWDNRSRRVEWVEASEVAAAESERVTIGFRG